jgi:hypothetical protein
MLILVNVVEVCLDPDIHRAGATADSSNAAGNKKNSPEYQNY